MLESEAIVVSISNGTTFVEPQVGGGCGASHCATQSCGTAVLTQIFSQKPKALQVKNPIAAGVGERVVVGLQEGAFLRTAVAVYLLPLCAFLAGTVLGFFWAGASAARDLYAGFGGLLGLTICVLFLKYSAPTLFPRGVEPVILRRL